MGHRCDSLLLAWQFSTQASHCLVASAPPNLCQRSATDFKTPWCCWRRTKTFYDGVPVAEGGAVTSSPDERYEALAQRQKAFHPIRETKTDTLAGCKRHAGRLASLVELTATSSVISFLCPSSCPQPTLSSCSSVPLPPRHSRCVAAAEKLGRRCPLGLRDCCGRRTGTQATKATDSVGVIHSKNISPSPRRLLVATPSVILC